MGRTSTSPSASPTGSCAKADVPDARVHRGYNDALFRLFNEAGLQGELDKAKNTWGRHQRVLVTGHSKGGGVRQVLALELVRAGWDVVLVTFGAPPSINQAALDILAGSERLQAIRVCNVMDLVPNSLDWHSQYRHLGRHIELDNPLLESVNVLASGIKAAMHPDNGVLDKVMEAGNSVIEHHSMKRYIENLKIRANGSALALAWYGLRTFEHVTKILDALPEEQKDQASTERPPRPPSTDRQEP